MVRQRLDAVRAGALPVREPGVVRRAQPRRLHRRVHRADPRLVLRHARARDAAVRPARVLDGASATASCSATTAQKMSKSLRNYPDVSEVFDRDGSDAMRWFLLASPGAARRQPDRDGGGDPGGRAADAAAALEHLLLLHALRRCGGLRRAVAHRLHRSARPVRARRDRRPRARAGGGPRRVRHRRRDPAPPRLRRPADELVRAAVARAVLGGQGRVRRAAGVAAARRSTPSSPCSRP